MNRLVAVGHLGGLAHRLGVVLFRFVAAGSLCLLALGQQARAASSAPFVMGTVDTESAHIFKWVQQIYGEAFRRLGIALEIVSYPTQRIGVLLDQGAIDGEAARARVYADAHPQLIRVEETVLDAAFELYAAKALELKQLEDLRATKLRVGHRRGVLYCERALAAVLPPEQMLDVTEDVQGLQMLLAGRADAFCGVDLSIQSALRSPELKGNTAVRSVLVLQPAPLFPYLLRKHSDLAPRLAATLKAMKREGLIERYRQQAFGEIGR